MAASTYNKPVFAGLKTGAVVTLAGYGITDAYTSAQVDALVAGSQPLDADLTAIASLTSAADRLPYYTGSGTAALATFTAAGRALMDDATAAAQRATLGLQYTVGTGGMLKSFCDSTTTQAGTSGTAFWVYVGFLPAGTVIQHVGVAVNTGGSGAQTAEVCVATGTGPPAFAAQTLTKVWADGTLGDLTVSASYVRNTTPNATALAADAHVWVGFRQAMASSQANLHAIQKDFGAGNFMSTAASGALTGSGPWTGTPIAFGGAHADIRGYC